MSMSEDTAISSPDADVPGEPVATHSGVGTEIVLGERRRTGKCPGRRRILSSI